MNNPRLSKRKRTIIRIANYALMTLAVIALSIICIFLILGYQFNTQKGTIDQGGLVQFRSFPSGAKITLDGSVLNFQTPGKQNVSAGNHSVSMQRSGYHDWTKTFKIRPGELRWLNYTRFIPKNITTSQVTTLPNVASAMPSPDRQWLAVVTEPNQGVITVFDLRDEKKIVSTQLVLPASAMTELSEGQTQSFKIAEWDFGARFILIERTFGETKEFIRVERSDAKTALNVTELFHLPFSVMHFSGTSGNTFYGLNGTDLRFVDASSKVVSQPLVQNVKQFELYKEKDLAYVAVDKDVQKVGVMRDSKQSIVRTFPASESVYIDLSSFSNYDYMAISHGLELEIVKDPLDNADSAGRVFATRTLKLPSVGWLMFSSSGRFVVAGTAGQYETYDIETDEHFASKFDGDADAQTPLKWLDDFYLTSSASGTIVISEFDGTNSHQIATAVPGLPITLSDDGNYLYSIGKSENGFILQSSKLNIEVN